MVENMRVMSQMLILLAVLFSMVSPILVLEEEQLIYGVGDYFVYETIASIKHQNFSCIVNYRFRIDITSIDYPFVYFNFTTLDINTTGNCPSTILKLATRLIPATGTAKVDLDPKEAITPFFVKPTYSGEYSVVSETSTIKLVYNKGVLVNGTLKYVINILGSIISVNAEVKLVDTSVSSLKTTSTWLTLILLLVIIVVAGGLVVYIVKHRGREKKTMAITQQGQ